jgi:hypothetical protein
MLVTTITKKKEASDEIYASKFLNLISDLESQKLQASEILEQIRKTAGEQGVSQEAHHFDFESIEHKKSAENWLVWLSVFSTSLIVCGVLSLFLHKIPFLKPEDWYDTIQLITSKVIIFGVLSYVVVLCGKSFQAHKHNQTLNRHRRNALQTYKSIVDATTGTEAHDTILQQAAKCIFEHQDTGFMKNQNTTTEISNPAFTIKAGE